MILDKKEIGGYYGIFREILLFEENEILIRFNAFGNDEIDLEFSKKYDTKEAALSSIDKYVKATVPASKIENGPDDGDWKSYEQKVNLSIIKLFKDTIEEKIILPDEGFGFIHDKSIESLAELVKKSEDGTYIRFVNYDHYS